jgi:hypothetical protein
VSNIDSQKALYFPTSVNKPECVFVAWGDIPQDKKGIVITSGDCQFFGKCLHITKNVGGLIGKLKRLGITKAQFIFWPKTDSEGNITQLDVVGVRHPSLNPNDKNFFYRLPDSGYGSLRGTVVKVGGSRASGNRWVKVIVGQDPQTGDDIIIQAYFNEAGMMYPGDKVAMDININDGILYTYEVLSNLSMVVPNNQKTTTVATARPARPERRLGRVTRQRSSATA